MKIMNVSSLKIKEFVFQLLLHSMVFVFFAFDKKTDKIELIEVCFFMNFSITALIIDYLLLPKFLYKNKYFEFIISFIVVLGGAIFFEELVLEPIIYPETRGKNFSNVFYTLLGMLPTISILVGFKFAWDALMKQREVLALKNSVEESELQFLKSQINPHFLFNNMNNLYSYAVENSPRTPDIILEFSSVLRYMLYECREKYVDLNKEVSHLENYINLSKLQMEGRGIVNLIISNLSTSYEIAPLILTVFIENAFKHSVSSQSKEIEISIQISVSEKGVLNFKCNNTFLESSNTDNLDSGIGLLNVRKRLELIYPNSHLLEIISKNNHYIVNLMIELKKRN